MAVHPTAVIHPRAQIDRSAEIGAFAVLGECRVSSGSVVHPHVVIADGVEIASDVEIFPGAFLGKEPKGAGATARKPEYARQVTVARGCSIGPHAVVYYDVMIGDHTLLGDGASVREKCRIGMQCIVSRYVTVNYNTVIGNRVKIMDNTHITGNMIIGDDAFISDMVGTANDNIIRAGYGDHVVGPVIEAGAIVGAGAILLPAVRIGKGASVAAGAVVTKDIAAATLVAGIPARHVRKLGD